MKLTRVDCYSCGSKEYTHYDSENGYDLVKCSDCGLLYLNPRPAEEEISKALATGVHRGESTINFTGKYVEHKIHKYLGVLSDIYPEGKSVFQNKKWLDIGCGYGELLEALNLYSDGKIIVRGSEPNEAKQQSAKSKNLDVSFIDLDSHEEKYDYISFMNVFSHLPDPVGFIAGLRKNLNPGGEIVMQTGHSCHLPAKYHHKPYQVPDHLSFANQEIVEDIFKRTGYEVLKVKIYRFDFFPYKFDLMQLVKEVVKIIIRRRKNLEGLSPRYPYRDMFVRCRLMN